VIASKPNGEFTLNLQGSDDPLNALLLFKRAREVNGLTLWKVPQADWCSCCEQRSQIPKRLFIARQELIIG